MSENHPSRILFSGPTVTLGEFRCPPGHPLWSEENTARGALFVFPRVAVGIDQTGRDHVLADPNTVMFYNPGQPYRRRLVSDRGDECEFFVIDRAAAAEAIRRIDPRAADDAKGPFPFAHGPGDPKSYARQRRLCEQIRRHGKIDPLEIEESALHLLGSAVDAAWRIRGRRSTRRDDTTRAHVDLAEATKLLLWRRMREPLRLDAIARAVHSSPFHLCRVFRRQTGVSLHRYRDRLRLNASLEPLTEGRALLPLALDLGYSSHSHFTDAFRREYGATPSAFRAAARGTARTGRIQGATGVDRR